MALFVKNNSASTLVFKGGYITIPTGQAEEVSQHDIDSGIFKDFQEKGYIEIFEAETKSFFERALDVIEEIVEDVKDLITDTAPKVEAALDKAEDDIGKALDKAEAAVDKAMDKADETLDKVSDSIDKAVVEVKRRTKKAE